VDAAKANQVGKFFGPYPSAYNARDTLLVLQKLFNVRQCENSFFHNVNALACNIRSNAVLRLVSV
jgi:excinuclease UvrABC nuclease subunit